ncbi:MAG TPA: type VII secretion target [Acidothermaceae bacterium]
MADGFAVTPGELLELAQGVSAIRGQLEATPDLVADLSPALGSSEVAGALHHFVSGWRDGRKQISAEVGALSDMLSQAAEAYYSTDSSIASAIP